MFHFRAPDSQETAIRHHQAHIDRVKATAPPDQLVIIDITAGEGWEPLCRFLNRPIPEVPLPKLNDSAAVAANGEFLFLDSYREFFGAEEQEGMKEKYKRVLDD